jgi:hypothetical protein
MAGFQKFPVPRSAFVDFWNYNKKWMGNTAAVFSGTVLIWMSFNRLFANRTVMYRLITESKRWNW